ncbi:MAG: amidohydrolase family protein [Deltaproteobacteria bacterium]|jgi:predicted TIM-barrel fold metal-dependent hydrolase
MKIDIAAHIMPLQYKDALYHFKSTKFNLRTVIDTLPTMVDLDHRFRVMDKFEGMMQVLTLTAPAVEEFADAKKSPDFAKLANEAMADLVLKHPDRFAAAVACLPMNNIDAAVDEIDRAVNDLKFRGVQINTPINDKPLDAPEFMPIYEKMAQYNLPIWIHPMRTPDFPDYRTEKTSKFMIFHVFGWPYETAAAMTRLVFSGVFEKFPDLKFIVHHAGGMVPFLEERIVGAYDHAEMQRRAKYKVGLTKAPIEYFKKSFYYDTAIYGNTGALMCTRAFCGAEQMLFGTDFPYDSQFGERYLRQTIAAVDGMDLDQAERKMIFEDNARKLMRLPV